LQAILDLPKDTAGFVADKEIAQHTRIALKDVKDWIEGLDGDGLVEIAPTLNGQSGEGKMDITDIDRL